MDKIISNKQNMVSETIGTEYGYLTTINNQDEVIPCAQISYDEKAIFAVKLYDHSSYTINYLLIDSVGHIVDVVQESEGILPRFYALRGRQWVSVTIYHPDKDMEISLPVFDREKAERPKAVRSSTGSYIGDIDDVAMFYDRDVFSAKPDRLLTVAHKNGVVKTRKNIKVPLPARNKAMANNDGIHLVVRQGKVIIHRLMSLSGEVLAVREIELGTFNCMEPIKLDFAKATTIISTDGGKVYLYNICPQGMVDKSLLIDIGTDIYNTWEVEKLSQHVGIVRFTFENGNGWLTLRENTLIEVFVSDATGYVDLLSKQKITLPYADVILDGVVKTCEDCYALSFYPRQEQQRKVIFIVNRAVIS